MISQGTHSSKVAKKLNEQDGRSREKIEESYLDQDERTNLVATFRNKEFHPSVLIIMYAVSPQGVNLDQACSKVLVLTSAVNPTAEAQAWG